MKLVFLLSVLSGFPEDVEFSRIQEQWIAGVSRSWQREGRIDRSIRALGARYQAVRADARAICGLWKDRLLPSLLIAEHSSDPEVRHQATRIVESLFVCRECGGTGICPKCKKAPGVVCDCSWRYACRACDGTGDYRYLYAPYEEAGYCPKDLFPARPEVEAFFEKARKRAEDAK